MPTGAPEALHGEPVRHSGGMRLVQCPAPVAADDRWSEVVGDTTTGCGDSLIGLVAASEHLPTLLDDVASSSLQTANKQQTNCSRTVLRKQRTHETVQSYVIAIL